MNDELQIKFQKHKQLLLDFTWSLEKLIFDGSFARAFPEIRDNLQAERFRLVVLGQFKRGKSTFINALLGERILPTDVIPVTAVITEIHHGAKGAARVFFWEGEPRQVAIPELEQYASEASNIKNVKDEMLE